MADGGLEVPKAAFRESGYLTDAGGMTAPEYQRRVISESKAEKAVELANRRESSLAGSVADMESDMESLRSELSQRQAASYARRSRSGGQPSLRGVNGQAVPFTCWAEASSRREEGEDGG